MKTRRLWTTCLLIIAAVPFVSCDKEQMTKTLADIQVKTNEGTRSLLPVSQCPQGEGPVSAAPEFCFYMKEFRLLNNDTQAEVSLSIVNRSDRRLFLSVSHLTYLTDSSGTKWGVDQMTGIGRTGYDQPLSLDPQSDAPVALLFRGRGQAPADLTFAMRGEMAIAKVGSRGEPIGGQPKAVRGFSFSGIRVTQQQSQSGGSGQRPQQPSPKPSVADGAVALSPANQCPQADGPVSAAPEFCFYMKGLRLLNNDTQAEVSLTIVNRSDRRLFLSVSHLTYLTDSSGTKWGVDQMTGIGRTGYDQPLSLDPQSDAPVALLFRGRGQAPPDLTFAMRGEMAIAKVDSRGEPVGGQPKAVRGFSFSGIRVQQQQSQSTGRIEQRGETALTTPSFSRVLPEAATPSAPVTPVNVDIVGLRLGMTPEEVRQVMQEHNKNLKITEQQASLQGVVPEVAFLSKVTGALDRRLAVGPLDSIGVHFPPPPHKSQAIFIDRFTGFEQGKQPLTTAIKDGLINKYGPPSYNREAGHDIYLMWAFDPSGRQIINNIEKRCTRFGISEPQSTPNAFFDNRKSSDCGVAIVATLGRNDLPGNAYSQTATYLYIYILDDSRFSAMRTETQAYAENVVRESAKKVAVPKF